MAPGREDGGWGGGGGGGTGGGGGPRRPVSGRRAEIQVKGGWGAGSDPAGPCCLESNEVRTSRLSATDRERQRERGRSSTLGGVSLMRLLFMLLRFLETEKERE